MKNDAVKTICKTVLIAILIYTSSTTFVTLFGLGLWPIALLLLLLAIIASIIYFIVYLVKMRGYKKLNEEIDKMKNRIENLERQLHIEKIVKESDKKRGR